MSETVERIARARGKVGAIYSRAVRFRRTATSWPTAATSIWSAWNPLPSRAEQGGAEESGCVRRRVKSGETHWKGERIPVCLPCELSGKVMKYGNLLPLYSNYKQLCVAIVLISPFWQTRGGVEPFGQSGLSDSPTPRTVGELRQRLCVGVRPDREPDLRSNLLHVTDMLPWKSR